jgi:hypothetical protein
MALHATVMLKILHQLLAMSAHPDYSEPEKVTMLKDCIRHHIRIWRYLFLNGYETYEKKNFYFRFCRDIEEFFSPCNIGQLFISTFIICVVAFAFSSPEVGVD